MLYKLQSEIFSRQSVRSFEQRFSKSIEIGRCLRDRYISNTDYSSELCTRSINIYDGLSKFADDLGYNLRVTSIQSSVNHNTKNIYFNATIKNNYYNLIVTLIKIWLYEKTEVSQMELNFSAAIGSEMICPYDSFIYDTILYRLNIADKVPSVTIMNMYKVQNIFVEVKAKRLGILDMYTIVPQY